MEASEVYERWAAVNAMLEHLMLKVRMQDAHIAYLTHEIVHLRKNDREYEKLQVANRRLARTEDVVRARRSDPWDLSYKYPVPVDGD